MSEEEFNYDHDLEINKDDLRRECSSQPKLLMKYVKATASKSKEVKHAKENLAKTRSRLTKAIISTSDKKPTVGEIEAHVIAHADYQTANHELIDLEYEYDIHKGAIDAFRQRKDMIQESIRLLGMNYYSAVEMPFIPGGKGMGEQMKEKASVNTRQTVNKKRRRTGRKS